MKFEVFTDVALTKDLLEHRLRRGRHRQTSGPPYCPARDEGYSIKVFNVVGSMIVGTAVPASALDALREDELHCAWALTC